MYLSLADSRVGGLGSRCSVLVIVTTAILSYDIFLISSPESSGVKEIVSSRARNVRCCAEPARAFALERESVLLIPLPPASASLMLMLMLMLMALPKTLLLLPVRCSQI